jgi:hypothetical protein
MICRTVNTCLFLIKAVDALFSINKLSGGWLATGYYVVVLA